jgi:hypothetical protein
MKNRKLTMIQIDVSPDDILEMHDRYQSGMCDTGTANAVSLALGKLIKPEYTPSIEFASSHSACLLRIGKDKHLLPQSVYWWLRDSENGIEVKPSHFTFSIYSDCLRRNGIESMYACKSSGEPLGARQVATVFAVS